MYRREPWFCQMDIMYSAQIIKIKLDRGNQSIHPQSSSKHLTAVSFTREGPSRAPAMVRAGGAKG